MAIKKISELNTKSFLGNPGAAANSYVLINYEDSTTNAPVTYKASLQELGKAIATELKLPTVTVSQGVPNLKVKTASNGAYVDNAISGFASTGYVTDAAERIANGVFGNLVPSLIMSATRDLASTGYVEDYVNSATSICTSIGYVNNIADSLATAIANVDGGGNGRIDPSTPVTLIDEYYNSFKVYPVFITGSHQIFYEASDSGRAQPIFRINGEQVVVYNDREHGFGYYTPGASQFTKIIDTNDLAVISTSSNKPCIRNNNGNFIGFLSET